MKSVLQVGDTAGVPNQLSDALRKLGMKSDVLSFYLHRYGWLPDYHRNLTLPAPLQFIQKSIPLLSLSHDYDVYHFHFATAHSSGADLSLWKGLGHRIILHHHGDDIRNKKERLASALCADQIVVSTPDLLRYSPDSKWIPNPVDLDAFKSYHNAKDDEILTVVHAPSDRRVKGTEYLIRAVNRLNNKKRRLRLLLVENTRHDRAIELYKEADIVVDQLLIGWYGMFAVECMALSKPVCAFIGDDLKPFLGKSPFMETSHAEIEKDLETLMEDMSLRRSLAQKGNEFVHQTHDSVKIARRFRDEVYG